MCEDPGETLIFSPKGSIVYTLNRDGLIFDDAVDLAERILEELYVHGRGLIHKESTLSIVYLDGRWSWGAAECEE